MAPFVSTNVNVSKDVDACQAMILEPGKRTAARGWPTRVAAMVERAVSDFLVVAVGDSITAGNPGWDPDPERRALEDPGDDETSQYLYWAARARPGMRFRNHGVGGERTDEIRARLGPAAVGADVIVVQGGINDIVQGRAVELAAADLDAMVRRAKELAPAVLLPNVLPWNNGWPDAEPAIRALNTLIEEIAARERVELLPFHETLEDPSAPGRMKPEWTPDGNHPSVEGHRRLGELAFRPRGG
jgi:lysophospholipase L1-like esterase